MTHLGDLEIFARVVSTGSMSAAGRALGFSAAVISKRIKRLEDRLGTRLLQRTTRQISMTEAGQGFYDRVLGILAGLEEAEAYASGRSSQVRGTLRISAPTSFGRLHIAPHLTGFMKDHPDLKLHIVLTDDFTDIVAEGFDLAIRIGELSDLSLVARRLAPVRRLLCAAPSYVASHGTPKDIGELASHICLPAHNNDNWKLEGPEGNLSYRPEGPLVTNSSEIIREAVIAGAGIALRSTWDIGRELRDGRLVQVLPQWEGSHRLTLSAVYPSRQFLPAKVRMFIDYLAALYGPVPYWEQ
ncbi:LysR family transcriptional regulator [Sinorhizobium medicae]|uniref:LysR family transcriptional regulator n=1 Tax=Sinorhizobium medicae TaxID=110321 RepID=A0A6G1WNI2_9HYPH|nr:LysR family transcriptional regulator [Sinorhizobium medicae]MQV97254.1 LysR family transcriptional regulator [Sinorhizobium medicae]MQW71256.1 LysR family transcriptional regulator [Sinorhizobium medicae]MQX84287.1 LysR family transcriptional regulator [Sinorhizobium medicae]